jgi:hypothetical protein
VCDTPQSTLQEHTLCSMASGWRSKFAKFFSFLSNFCSNAVRAKIWQLLLFLLPAARAKIWQLLPFYCCRLPGPRFDSFYHSTAAGCQGQDLTASTCTILLLPAARAKVWLRLFQRCQGQGLTASVPMMPGPRFDCVCSSVTRAPIWQLLVSVQSGPYLDSFCSNAARVKV